MKKQYTDKKGFGEVPFPQARPTPKLREEDAFMEAHGAGGWGGYRMMEALWTAGETVLGMLLRIVRPKNFKVRAPHSKSRSKKRLT